MKSLRKFTVESSGVQPDFFPDYRRDVPINIASVRHRSPFRYPGGKTWLVPYIRTWLLNLGARVENFVEPFAGGAIVGLSALFDELTTRVTLIEMDSAVGAVWQAVATGDGPELARRITQFDLNEKTLQEVLERSPNPDDIVGKAFITIVRNRVQRGGILAPGAGIIRNGENGRGIRSRWYPETLSNRLLDLHTIHQAITFISGDGIRFIHKHQANEKMVWFIDPPYTVAGRRLYLHSEIDHEKLFDLASRLVGPCLMTYDDTEEIRNLASKNGFKITQVAMKNTHHAVMKELLISRNLDWFHSASA